MAKETIEFTFHAKRPTTGLRAVLEAAKSTRDALPAHERLACVMFSLLHGLTVFALLSWAIGGFRVGTAVFALYCASNDFFDSRIAMRAR